MKKITRKDWRKSGKDWGEFTKNKPKPVEVDEDIFMYFMEVLPPEESGKTREAFKDLPLAVQEYYLVGEPQSTVNGRFVYSCFVRAFDTKYFWVGYVHKMAR